MTLEQALNQMLTANQLFYKIQNERTILIFPDTPQKRQAYEEQVIQTFYVSHADVTELSRLLNTILRGPAWRCSRPLISANKTANTITMRGSAAMVAIIERVIEANDKPRAEVVIDVEILEVNRTRAKQYGLNLSNYAIGGVFSPEGAPAGGTASGSGGQGGTAAATSLFNLNTISRGINTADFYLAVPQAVVRFLESDSKTKLIAKPQLRGQEGKKLTLNLGDEIPVPSTTFTPITSGGTAVNPLTSFQYRPVGVNVEITPRVTYDRRHHPRADRREQHQGKRRQHRRPEPARRSARARSRRPCGCATASRTCSPACCARTSARSLTGFPGAIHVPILKQLFSANDNQIEQTDIVMLLTPRIIRTHGLTDKDLAPIYIGTQQNLGLGGPPPLIAPSGSPRAARHPAGPAGRHRRAPESANRPADAPGRRRWSRRAARRSPAP